MSFFKLLAFLFIFLVSASISAEIYKWTDENGKVHFGEMNNDIRDRKLEKIKIRDKYVIPDISKEDPLEYSGDEGSRLISVSSIKMDMPRSNYDNVRIGRVSCASFRRPIDLFWQDGVKDLKDSHIGVTVSQSIVQSGYESESSIGSIPTGGSLNLELSIKDLKINFCPKARNSDLIKASSFVKVQWSLYDPLTDEKVFSAVTMGTDKESGSRFVKEGLSESLKKSFQVATNNLLAKPDLAQLAAPVDLSKVREKFQSSIDIEYRAGSGNGSFSDVAADAKKNSVTIKTESGHGSGVFINDEGYLLTNEHVVGMHRNVTVLFDGQEYPATVVRKERIRDVALVKMKDYVVDASGVEVAAEEPSIGDELFVIGSPLKVEFRHTVTKGIVSAHRTINGQPYIQTDAAINRGNSGGAVFNEAGELVALTVSGVFTEGGASLNINYLIPIHDAFKALKVEEQSAFSSLKNKLIASGEKSNGGEETLVSLVKSVIAIVDNWLDKPIIKIY